jgi:2',3'-cyclic-nucleotide 2'-phosphodiesterase (5'-nucleotidase family)
MGYDSIAVDPLDLATGSEFLKTQNKPIFPWISANLLNTDNHPIFRPFIIKQIGQFTTGIIGWTGTASLPAKPIRK